MREEYFMVFIQCNNEILLEVVQLYEVVRKHIQFTIQNMEYPLLNKHGFNNYARLEVMKQPFLARNSFSKLFFQVRKVIVVVDNHGMARFEIEAIVARESKISCNNFLDFLRFDLFPLRKP